jgi:hypothetical protein
LGVNAGDRSGFHRQRRMIASGVIAAPDGAR